MLRIARSRLLALALVPFIAVAVAGCSDDEAPAGSHGTPATVRVFNVADGSELTEPLQLPAGATTRVEVRFYDADGTLLNQDLAAEHHTSLTFAPAEFATAAEVTGEVFQRDVTVAASGGATATVTVGYGHDVAADERSFGPFDVHAVPTELVTAR